LVFLAFCVGFVAIIIYGMNNGDPKKLLAPLDADGKFCGVEGLEGYNFVYFANITTANWLPSAVCVKSCPTATDEKVSC
jgi:hypothetical protein